MAVSLDDKYALEHGRAFMTGVQALARLPMLQHARDRAAGLNTAGFVSGYRGSPLGGLDLALTQAKPYLDAHHVQFLPGVNEELAATAVWGTQQLHLYPKPLYDGVFGMWYGKGPGVDRCGDVFKHANHAGTSKHGGVLAIAGDDHAARSSAVAHQSEHNFSACGMPVLAPAGLQEYLDYGLHGWAMSRYAGVWVAMKTTSDTVESSAVVEIDPARVTVRMPVDFVLPPDGVHLRWPDPQLAQERRIQEYKVYAALAYCRANGLNRIVMDSPRPRLGIIACGKAWLDVLQALDDLGIDARLAADIGIRLYKVGMVWPLEAEGVRRFAQGLEEILVVEEKRQIIEYQLKEELYNWREDVRPRVVGKYDEHGEWALEPAGAPPAHAHWLLPPTAELTPAIVARAIAARIGRFHDSPRMRERLEFLEAKDQAMAKPRLAPARTPWFCPGCPHNTSTKVPEGSCALGGVGCHLMAVWMGRNTLTFTQMGGEGAAWLGLARHTGTRHIFANMGDGTYFHSGILSIRAAVAAFNDPLPAGGGAQTPPMRAAGITYKLLYNDAVAMTGGQPLDGRLTVPQLTRQLAAEGVKRIVVMSDEPEKYAGTKDFVPGVDIRARAELERVQLDLREYPGVSVLIYDQTCAAEKRRRRKRGAYPDPARRVFINEAVCEGCGDCSVKSNCLAVVPVDTEFGTKRAIDQSACNKDYSCLTGFCPSLVSVEGGRLRRGAAAAPDAAALAALPEPQCPPADDPYGILIAGVGGTGVVTVGALLGMAAHLEGKGVTVLDMTGLAQKGGAVLSHVRICARQERLHAARIATGEADALIACDLLVALSEEALAKLHAGRTRAVANAARSIGGEFIAAPDQPYPDAALRAQLTAATGASRVDFVDALALATALTGEGVATNVFLLGYSWQKGLLPVSEQALLQAMQMNAVAVEANRDAFAWGRLAAHDGARVAALAFGSDAAAAQTRRISRTLDGLLERRVAFLTDYQDAAYGARYRALVERVRAAEAQAAPGSQALAEAVARGYFKLLASKDEYEVARLHAASEFHAQLARRFEGDYRLRFHLAIPLLDRVGPDGAEPPKRSFGPWMLSALRVLARARRLRGTLLDPFRHTPERRLERELVADYEASIAALLARLRADHLPVAVEIARLPETIRGYGHVKRRNAEAARARALQLMRELDAPPAAAAAPQRACQSA